jgi:hypothetical protein
MTPRSFCSSLTHAGAPVSTTRKGRAACGAREERVRAHLAVEVGRRAVAHPPR